MSTMSSLSLPRIEVSAVHATLRKSLLVDGFDFVVDLQGSRGSRLRDARSGRDYLDFFNYFATQPLGHNHPAMLDEDFLQAIGRVATTNPSNSDFYTPEMAAFVQTLRVTAQPPSLPHAFFVAGGALAVENGLKAAFDWKFQKRAARGLPDLEDLEVIHFREAFHGRSGYTLSLTNTSALKVRAFPKFDWPRVSNPKIVHPLAENLHAVQEAERRSLAEIERHLQDRGDRIAALIIEPIQGEGGDNHFRGEFLRELRRLCDEHELLFAVDEVQTGVGTTGCWWAYQHFGFEPDVLCFGKKMQVCGILAGPRLDEVDSVFSVPGRINSTWGGNLVDMVRATRYLQVIEQEDLVSAAARRGEQFLERLLDASSRHPDRILEARGRGLFVAFTLPDAILRDAVIRGCRDEGLLIIGAGEKSIRARPALTVTPDEIDEACDVIERVVARI